jgi:hypothetical protein
MDALQNRSMNKLNDDFDDILNVFRTATMDQKAAIDRVVRYAERVLSSVLSGDGDFTLESAELIIAKFDEEFIKAGENMQILIDVAGLRKKDSSGKIIPAATMAALTAFKAKYDIDTAENFNRYHTL